MKEKHFEDYIDLGCYMYDIATNEESISSVLFFDDAVELMQDLLEYGDVYVGNILIDSNYAREYYVTLTDELVLNIVPVFDSNNDIVEEQVDYMLFDEDASSKIAVHNKCEQYEIVYGDYEDNVCGDCCEDCSNCQRRMTTEALDMALDILDYVLNR